MGIGDVVTLSAAAGFPVLIGVLIALYFRPPKDLLAFLLCFTVGLLAGVVCFDLLPRQLTDPRHLAVVVGAFMAGAVLFMAFDKWVLKVEPGEGGAAGAGPPRLGLLLLFAVTLDDIPEGLAIGVASHIGTGVSMTVALVLAIQNLTEGLVEGREMLDDGYTRRQIVKANFAAALVPIATAALGFYALRDVGPLVRDAVFACSAGAILYMTFTELAPKARYEGNLIDNLGSVLGFISTYVLSAVMH